MDKLIAIKEAAELLGVDPKTLRRWESDGKISSQKTIGGHRRYLLSEIEAMQGCWLSPQKGGAMSSSMKEAELLELDVLNDTKQAADKYGMDVKGKKITLILTADAINRIHYIQDISCAGDQHYGLANHELVIAILRAIQDNENILFVAKKGEKK